MVCNAFEKCTLPFFVTICFAEIIKWKSYSGDSETVIPFSLEKSIAGLFDQASKNMNKNTMYRPYRSQRHRLAMPA